MRYLIVLFMTVGSLLFAAGLFDADVVVIGETHDNPHHHARQAELVSQIQPTAIVFEQLTTSQAENHVPGAAQATLEAAFGWANSGWPDFAMYYPIFAAAPDAQIFGAGVPRDAARSVLELGLETAFGQGAAEYGLIQALPAAEQSAREAMQMAAHCDALPEQMLPDMVDIQRLRDAELARVTITALLQTGGPVVVITGNGHARTDWGMPVYLSRVMPQLTVHSIGLDEDNGISLSGSFDSTETFPSVERGDPCDAFR